MKIVGLVSTVSVLMISGCQHNDRLVEPTPPRLPSSHNSYLQFQLGDSLGYGNGSVIEAYCCVDTIVQVNHERYYRFRYFPMGAAWGALSLREDPSGNVMALATDSLGNYMETSLFEFNQEPGATWVFDYGQPEPCTLESLTDTVIEFGTAYVGCARIRVGADVYWIAPGVGAVKYRFDPWPSFGPPVMTKADLQWTNLARQTTRRPR